MKNYYELFKNNGIKRTQSAEEILDILTGLYYDY